MMIEHTDARKNSRDKKKNSQWVGKESFIHIFVRLTKKNVWVNGYKSSVVKTFREMNGKTPRGVEFRAL